MGEESPIEQPTYQPPSRSPRFAVAVLTIGFFALLAAFAAAIFVYWVSSSELHTVVEAVSTLLAAFVGLVTIARYRAKKEAMFLLVASAFLGAALLDAYHMVVTSSWFASAFPSPPRALAPWSWMASRLYLSTLLALSGFTVGSRIFQGSKNTEVSVFTASFLYLVAIALVFALAPLPEGYQASTIARPQELIPGAFLVLALVGHLRSSAWRKDTFLFWLLASIGVGAVAQVLYMPLSSNLYDSWFDLAHGLKAVSYLTALGGAVLGMSALFTGAERSARSLRALNASLEGGLTSHALALVERAAELDQANRDLSAANQQLQRANQELEQFAYIASHDLQEPLRMIAGFTNLLQRRYQGQLDERADEYIQYAVDGSHRMQQLINDLLTYSRAGRNEKPPEPVDLNAVVREALANLSISVQEKRASVRVDPLPIVYGDSIQLTQVFQNLIGNGLKFGKPNVPPEITITVQRDGGFWQISIEDNGAGFDPQYADRVFIIFERLQRDVAGTGIGLPVCKKIIERHGGRIWVETEQGRGSTFLFTLPDSQISNEREGGHAVIAS